MNNSKFLASSNKFLKGTAMEFSKHGAIFVPNKYANSPKCEPAFGIGKIPISKEAKSVINAFAKNESLGKYLSAIANKGISPLPVSAIVSYAALFFEANSSNAEKKERYDAAKKELVGYATTISKLADALARKCAPDDPIASKVSHDAQFCSTMVNSLAGNENDVSNRHIFWKISAQIINEQYAGSVKVQQALEKMEQNIPTPGKFAKTANWIKGKSGFGGPVLIVAGLAYFNYEKLMEAGKGIVEWANNPPVMNIVSPIGEIITVTSVVSLAIVAATKWLTKNENNTDRAKKNLKAEHQALGEEESKYLQTKIDLIANDAIFLSLANGYFESVKTIAPVLYAHAAAGRWSEVVKEHSSNIDGIRTGKTPDYVRVCMTYDFTAEPQMQLDAPQPKTEVPLAEPIAKTELAK